MPESNPKQGEDIAVSCQTFPRSIIDSSISPLALSAPCKTKHKTLSQEQPSPNIHNCSERHVTRRRSHTHEGVGSLLKHVGRVRWHLGLPVHRRRHQSRVHACRPGLVIGFNTGVLYVRVPSILFSTFSMLADISARIDSPNPSLREGALLPQILHFQGKKAGLGLLECHSQRLPSNNSASVLRLASHPY